MKRDIFNDWTTVGTKVYQSKIKMNKVEENALSSYLFSHPKQNRKRQIEKNLDQIK